MRRGLIILRLRNQELIQLNKQQTQQLEIVVEELNQMKQERREKEIRKQTRANRKRLPKRDPMTAEIYELLIDRSRKLNRNFYLGARLRLALALLAITGVRVSELLPIKVNQFQQLMEKGWIGIDRAKRGSASHKAFLTPQGRKILQKRRSDFETIIFAKDDDSYIFTPEYSADPLNRDAFQKIINLFLKESVQELPNQPNIRSHSFRIGFITKLWKDTNDLELVRQIIGHAKIDTTSQYVQDLSDEERQQRMIHLQSTDD